MNEKPSRMKKSSDYLGSWAASEDQTTYGNGPEHYLKPESNANREVPEG